MTIVYEVAYLDVKSTTFDYNYDLFKTLSSSNLIETLLNHKEYIYDNLIHKRNLISYIPDYFTNQDIIELWNQKPDSYLYITIFKAIEGHHEYHVTIRTRVILD